MLSTLIKKELLDNLLSFRFIITLLLCLVLIPLGIFVSIKEYENARADYQQSLGLVRDASQGMRNAIDVEAKGLRPPSPFRAAPSRSCAFQVVIWFGCTSNCCASSASVFSPFTAANATFALKAGL